MMDLRTLKVEELRDIARDYVITGAWKMTKDRLIERILSAAELNGHSDKYFDSEAQNEPEQTQDAPESIEESQADKLLVNEESSTEPTVEPSMTADESTDDESTDDESTKLKSYGAWVVNRETKELTTVVGEAESREAFYLSIKGQYRVRLIIKPEKLEEECKQWEIRHARNKKLKNEKYAADKAEASKLGMKVHEYRKHLRESTKTNK